MFEQTVSRMAGIGAMPYSKLVEQSAFTPFAVEDTNGNELTQSADTLGRPLTNGLTYYDSNGTLQTIQVVYESVAIYTHMCRFQGGDYCAHEYSATWSLPQIITLPNGLTYTFTYDLQGSATHPYYGQPLSVTLPTGGSITWGGAAKATAGRFSSHGNCLATPRPGHTLKPRRDRNRPSRQRPEC
jgi:hypothetical protein